MSVASLPIPLVLASASPARLTTLTNAGIGVRVIVSTVDEQAVMADAFKISARLRTDDPTPMDEALMLARAKAEDVADHHVTAAFVLGCDSVLEMEGRSYGKPGTVAAARDRWRAMRGKSGTLLTGHWLIDDRDPAHRPAGVGQVSATTVHFAELSDAEIDAYVATGEPLAVAGGFTLDGLGGPFVDAIEGDHHGVVGISLPLLRQLLAAYGVAIHELWT